MNKLIQLLMQNLKWIIMFGCVIIFLEIAENVLYKEIMQSDIIIHSFIYNYLVNDFMTPIVKGITWLGGAFCLIAITAILLIFIKSKKVSIAIAINLAIIAALNQVLKAILQRPRPVGYRIIDENGYSFPSGHSMASMAFYGFLIYLIYKYITNKYLKWTLISLLSLLIIFIGCSRIYLGVHYASDVIAGGVLSIAYLIVFTNIFSKLHIEGENNEK